MPDYKELGRALMSFEYTPQPEDKPAPPSFENDPEYERAVLDACVPPEPLCPATSKSSVARVCGGGWLTAAADPPLPYGDGRARTLEVLPTNIIAATGVGKQGRGREAPGFLGGRQRGKHVWLGLRGGASR
jgi:hypothetical protein